MKRSSGTPEEIGEPDAIRLERLWKGEFGDKYTVRNQLASTGRESFWKLILTEFEINRVLEVGCNSGPNLKWISNHLIGGTFAGVDINENALSEMRNTIEESQAVRASARRLPFRSSEFDLVFTTGVLIHQSPEALPEVMSEIVRCSNRYILCGEYFAEELTEVPYRGESGALWKEDFGRLYKRLFPELLLRKKGFLSRTQGGWDDITYWVFEKPQ